MPDAVSRLFQIIEFMASSNDWVSLRTMARDMKQGQLSVKDREQLQARIKEMTKLMDQIHQASAPPQ